jgi:hypothetical protein
VMHGCVAVGHDHGEQRRPLVARAQASPGKEKGMFRLEWGPGCSFYAALSR